MSSLIRPEIRDSEMAAGPACPSCYHLFPGPRIQEYQLISPDPFLHRARPARALFRRLQLIQDRYKVAEIEHAADSVVWCCDEAPGFVPGRPQDLAFVGNIVNAIEAYGRGAGAGRDPVTGTETVVFSCFNQDQEMDRVDFRPRVGSFHPAAHASANQYGPLCTPLPATLCADRRSRTGLRPC